MEGEQGGERCKSLSTHTKWPRSALSETTGGILLLSSSLPFPLFFFFFASLLFASLLCTDPRRRRVLCGGEGRKLVEKHELKRGRGKRGEENKRWRNGNSLWTEQGKGGESFSSPLKPLKQRKVRPTAHRSDQPSSAKERSKENEKVISANGHHQNSPKEGKRKEGSKTKEGSTQKERDAKREEKKK